MSERTALLDKIFAETYLGDGLYCRVDQAGQFVLRAPREDGDHVICLEPLVLEAFQDHVARMSALIAELNQLRPMVDR